MSYSQTGILQAIKKDHDVIYSHFEKYADSQSKGDIAAQQHSSSLLIWELARHAIGEELIVHPLFETYLGEAGKTMAKDDRAEHQKLKDLLVQLATLEAGSRKHALLQEMIDKLRHHTTEEEAKDLPDLEDKISATISTEAAIRFSRTRYFNPSVYPNTPYTTLDGLFKASTGELQAELDKFPSVDRRGVQN